MECKTFDYLPTQFNHNQQALPAQWINVRHDVLGLESIRMGGADMLVLSTKTDDGVQIGDEIRITVIDVRPRNVRLGIEAPQSISIKRDPAASRKAQPSNTIRRSANGSAVSQPFGKNCAVQKNERDADGCDQPHMSVMVISRDQPLLGRLNSVLGQDRASKQTAVSSITEGKRRIAAQQAIDPASGPDLVLLDADLSPQTAILFLRWLRQNEARQVMPVLAMRGESTPHSTAALLTAGANVVVSKDQPWRELRTCICSAVEMWRCAESRAEPRSTGLKVSLQEAVA